ncbi:LOW QUALITY PROTEIN: hypothetical protein ACHAXT_011125 [Thalassiosira profunda]
MSATDAAIGMMDGAYFTSRNELLTFLNTLLDLNLSKIEQTASGAVACQLTEYIFPGSVPCPGSTGRPNPATMDKLIRGKYQDNLEFCQWLKAFFDQTAPMMAGGREGYDPVAVRAKGKGGKGCRDEQREASACARRPARERDVGPAGRGAERGHRADGNDRCFAGASRRAAGAPPPRRAARARRLPPGSGSSAASKENKANARPPAQPRSKAGAPTSAASAAKVAKLEEENRALKSETAALTTKYSELELASSEMEMNLNTIESERDFYFEKLRGIEVMLQVRNEEAEAGSGDVNRVMDSIFKVMYATQDDDIAVDDEGNLVGDITVDASVNSINQSALVPPKAQDDQGDEELLTSGLDESAAGADVVPEEQEAVPPVEAQFSSDSDDEELLTDGLDSPPVEKVVGPAVEVVVATEALDEDSFADEDLLAD